MAKLFASKHLVLLHTTLWKNYIKSRIIDSKYNIKNKIILGKFSIKNKTKSLKSRERGELKLKFTNASDAGDFECQVSTNPKISQVFKLTVVGEKKSKDYIWVEWSKFHHIFLIAWVLEYDLRDNLSISYCTFCFNDKHEQFVW